VFQDRLAGEAELDALGVFEINDDGLWERVVMFDMENLEDAMRELEASASRRGPLR